MRIVLTIFGTLLLVAVALIAILGLTEAAHNKAAVGKHIIIGTDTTTIVKYNTSYGFYVTEEGLVVDLEHANIID